MDDGSKLNDSGRGPAGFLFGAVWAVSWAVAVGALIWLFMWHRIAR